MTGIPSAQLGLALRADALGTDHPDLAVLSADKGHFSAAESPGRRALRIFVGVLKADDPQLKAAREKLTFLLSPVMATVSFGATP